MQDITTILFVDNLRIVWYLSLAWLKENQRERNKSVSDNESGSVRVTSTTLKA
jgi:hypothetical protein